MGYRSLCCIATLLATLCMARQTLCQEYVVPILANSPHVFLSLTDEQPSDDFDFFSHPSSSTTGDGRSGGGSGRPGVSESSPGGGSGSGSSSSASRDREANLVYAVGSDKTIKQIRGSNLIREVDLHTITLSSVVLSHDGNMLFTGNLS